MSQVVMRQSAVIPVWQGRVALVTSSGGRRWVLPKGTVEKSQTPLECARQETWEEAGLRGELLPDCLGTYEMQKWGQDFLVEVYLMRVEEVASDWPEKSVRNRRWFRPDDAVEILTTPGQREALRAAMERGWILDSRESIPTEVA